MDNMGDKTKLKMNSAEENGQLRPDPIVQAKDDSSRSDKGVRSAEIVPARKTMPVAEATLLPNQFMRPAGPAQAGPSMNDMAESMWRYKWMIMAIFILVAAPAIAAIWTLQTPQYRARAELRIRPIIPFLVFRTEDNGMIPLYTSFVNTQVSIMRSPRVLDRVFDQQEIQDTQWYKEPPKSIRQRLSGNSSAPMERLRAALSVRPRRGTEITDVSMVAPSAEEAKLIVDTVLTQYQKYVAESSDASEEALYIQLVAQYKSLEQDIDGLESIATKFSKTLGTTNPETLISSQRTRLDQAKADIIGLDQIIDLLGWEINEANAVDSTGSAGDVVERVRKQRKYFADAEWRKLEFDVRTLRHRMTNSIRKPKHPQMARAARDLEFAEESLRLRESQMDEQWRDQVADAAGLPPSVTGADGVGAAGLSITIAGPGGLGATGLPIAIVGAGNLSGEKKLAFLEHQLARTIQQRDLLETDSKTLEAEFNELATTARLLANEKKKLKHKTELFTAVRHRLDQKTMERQVSGSISVLTKAIAPSQPYNDRRVVFTAMALVMGLGMGGGAAFLRASRSQIIYTPRDMPHPMQVPFLGYVPVASGRKSRCDEGVSPAIIESIRVVRTALLSRLNGNKSATLLITSAAPGTGKSTFTTMLGESLVKIGKKVLVIDADFHKMTLTKRFGLADKAGFIQSLRRKSVSRKHIFPSETSGLSILPAGKRDNGNTSLEEISNGAFKACMDKLTERYQIILLDSSPILTMADAAILSSQVDGTIVVERELVSRRLDLVSALAHLGSAGGRLLGTVFMGSGIRGHYGYGYGYHCSKNRES